MKYPPTEVEDAWPTLLVALLERSPLVTDVLVEASVADRDGSDTELDGDISFKVAGEPHRLIVECKSSGQPRHARGAILKLGQAIFRAHELTRGLFVAPFISPAVRELLAQTNIGWLDLAGNARVLFPRLHLEVHKADRDPFATKREQRSLFFPKSARILKVLLHQPHVPWKVADLADKAQVSLGQVSNVRRALIDREWATAEAGEGLRLTQPDALLDAWRDDGLHPPSVALRGYTLRHGKSLEAAMEAVFLDPALNGDSRVLLASHSVARRAAPYARIAGEFFYASDVGIRLLKRHLDIAPADKGENVTIYRPSDDGLWMETMPLRPPLQGTGPIQTYLDLLTTGERGREAAEHWRAEKIKPMLSGAV
ncbi:hypothetical protein [Methylibium rhizosphaerae]|uniref:hypothetical protein n=1 Tax=Methylibium rhizosphaerae TaxID=2570323 RepID=UPI001129C912|nr:hypothetical protein [Methylibium rhizosphaerae]